MEITTNQIKEALTKSHPEAYIRDNYGLPRAEARKAIEDYSKTKTKKFKRNLGAIIGSTLAIPLLFFAEENLRKNYNNSNISVQQITRTQPTNPQERAKLVEEAITPYSDVQLVLNPGQEKTLYIISQTHAGVFRNNKTGNPVKQVISANAISSQTDILNTLLRINQISPLEVIIGEGIGEGPLDMPKEDEQLLEKARKNFFNPITTARYFQENPFSQADFTYKKLYPQTIFAGIDQSEFDANFSTIEKKLGERFTLYPNIHDRGQLAIADPPTMELIKQECSLQEKRSITYLKGTLPYLRNHSNVAIVIGANHPARMATYLKQNPQKDINFVFLISNRADPLTKNLINSPDDLENFKNCYKIKN